MSLANGVQSTFTEHHNEIRRRSQLLRDDDDINAATFDRAETDAVDDPFRHPDQTCVLYSLSPTEFAPCPTEPRNPAVCIYGAFASMAEAHAHAAIVQREQPKYSILVGRTHEWIVAHATIEHMQDEYTAKHKERLLTAHDAICAANAREFAENVAHKRMGRVRKVSDESTGDASQEAVPSLNHKINASCRVDEQRFAVVSFLQDDQDVPEFMFRLYACYETEAEANSYVRNVCGDHVRNFDIDVIKLCSWAFPQLMEGINAQK